MSAADDQRVAQARRFLEGFPGDPELVTMPQADLARLTVRAHSAAVLLLDYVSSLGRAGAGQADTPAPARVSPDGGITLTREQLLTVLGALSDAVYCGEAHGIYDVVPGGAAVAAYRVLARSLGDDRR